MIHGREDLGNAERVVIKIGTSVLSPSGGFLNLTNMANIVEKAAQLYHEGKEVLIVSSGAAGVGRQLMARQNILRRSMAELLNPNRFDETSIDGASKEMNKASYNSACAAAGQLGLMSLYETMFNQFDITIAQILVTSYDFTSPERRRNVQYVVSQLLSKGIVPLLNENDPVSLSQVNLKTFSDNDALASLIAIEMNANLLILLTDVKGVYDRPPTDADAKIIDLYDANVGFTVGTKSNEGRGGMGAKVDAAIRSITGGVEAVIIAAGSEYNIIEKIMTGKKVGTMFLSRPDESQLSSRAVSQDFTTLIEQAMASASNEPIDVHAVARGARAGARQLQALTSAQRTRILLSIADALESGVTAILEKNLLDVRAAELCGVAYSLLSRLSMSREKIATLVAGIRSIAAQTDPVGHLLEQRELAEDLMLDRVSTPIGVLLVVFESRPDCLPQIAALAIRSGNGLILKGGKEAENSNVFLHSLIAECIERETNGTVSAGAIGLVTSRTDVNTLLKMDTMVDLVIPRGSNELVQFVKNNTTIPVMGHAAGVCHVYLDASADLAKALRIVVDAKTDYPSACNAVETLLVHQDLVESGVADAITRQLRKVGVTIYGGEKALEHGITENPTKSLYVEYGDLQVNVEVVSSMQEAVEFINEHGSGHTDCIVTEDAANAEQFVASLDSACCFVNASTRFADGFRFGLGAEVGIATGRIHARGPVGVEGLMTYKWILRSSRAEGHIATDFTKAAETQLAYTHKQIDLEKA